MSTVIEQLQFFSKQSWLPRAISLLILLLFLWWAISSFSSIFENNDKQAATTETPPSERASTADEKASLGQMNLFGRSKHLANSDAEVPFEKLTKLRFTLKGIFATNDPKQGAAQIQNNNQLESNFTVGQSVFGQATLDEIYPDRVILYRNGQYETLMMPGKALNAKYFTIAKQKQKASKKAETIKTSSSVQPKLKQPTSKQALYTQQSTDQNTTKKQDVKTDFRSIAISGSGEILRDLFIFNTAWRNGNFIGFFIEARGEKGLKLMNVLGVENHDLITVINGLRFSEKLDSPEQLEKLKTATSIDAIFERNGKEIPFHFEFDKPLSNL